MFPLGDWILLFCALLSWAEKHSSRRIFYSLLVAWLVGKILEGTLGWRGVGTWDWHYAHLLVIVVFWWWGWRKSGFGSGLGFRILPVFITILGVASVELFILNKPGLVPFEEWLPALSILLITVFLSSSFWEMVMVSTTGVLLNQGLTVFLYNGMIKHGDLPDPWTWNLGVLFFTGAGLYREIRATSKARASQPNEHYGICEASEVCKVCKVGETNGVCKVGETSEVSGIPEPPD